MSEGTTGEGTAPARAPARSTGRGNPAPRRALARVRPLPADDGAGAAGSPGAAGPTGADLAVPPAWSPADAAAAPGGTEGRDLLIPSRGHHEPKPGGGSHGHKRKKGAGDTPKGAPAVPSLAELMPPEAPSGRRRPQRAGTASSAARGRDARSSKESKESNESKDAKDAKTVELVVTLPKALRKRLKERAAERGMTPEQTVAQLVEVWIDG